MKKHLLAAAIAALMAAPVAATAQPTNDGVQAMQALRAAVGSDKKGYVASLLKLSDAEAKKFWPIYEEYQRSLEASDRKRARAYEGLITSGDKPVSDAYAKQLSSEALLAEEAEIKARRAMHNKLMRGNVLSDKKAAQYLQLEAKLRASKLYDITAAMPDIK